MKFACPKCSTRYAIADEKVPPAKTLRFPCSTCGNVIRLRRKAGTTATKRTNAPSALREGATRVAPRDEIERLRHDTVQATPAADTERATRVAPASEIRRMAPACTEDATDEEWYVLIAGKQQGPMPRSAVVAMLGRLEIDKRTYVWRAGMDDWLRLGKVGVFKAAAEGAGAAAWRVMAPLDDTSETTGADGGSDGATAAMDVDRLRERLARARDAGSGSDTKRGAQDVLPETAVGDPLLVAQAKRAAIEPDEELMEFEEAESLAEEPAVSAADSIDAPAAATAEAADPAQQKAAVVDPAIAGSLFEAAPGVSSADVISALSGEPTGHRMTREESGAAPALFQDDQQGRRLELDEESGQQMAAQIVRDYLGLSGATEEPLSAAQGVAPSFPGATPESDEAGAGYFSSPPGEATRVFIATAGLFRRRRTHRIAAVVGVLFSIMLVCVVSMDIFGVISIPGMGLVYDMTGLEDPNKVRSIERIDEKLRDAELSPEERTKLEARRAEMRGKLIGSPKAETPGAAPRRTSGGRRAIVREGVKDDGSLTAAERDMAMTIFEDRSKPERAIDLAAPEKIETPNLPDGLTQKSILKVITSNLGSMNLCMTDSMKKGESLDGRMDLTLTIAADGSVIQVVVEPAKLRNTVMGGCAKKRIRNWKFPAFNGDPIDVTYPLVLQMGL